MQMQIGYSWEDQSLGISVHHKHRRTNAEKIVLVFQHTEQNTSLKPNRYTDQIAITGFKESIKRKLSGHSWENKSTQITNPTVQATDLGLS